MSLYLWLKVYSGAKNLQVLPFFLRSPIPLFRWKDFTKGPERGLLELGRRKQNQGDNLLSWAQMMCMFGYVSRGGEERQKYQENVTLFQLSELRERGEGDGEGGREREFHQDLVGPIFRKVLMNF